jgi:hypothetical protein
LASAGGRLLIDAPAPLAMRLLNERARESPPSAVVKSSARKVLLPVRTSIGYGVAQVGQTFGQSSPSFTQWSGACRVYPLKHVKYASAGALPIVVFFHLQSLAYQSGPYGSSTYPWKIGVPPQLIACQ